MQTHSPLSTIGKYMSSLVSLVHRPTTLTSSWALDCATKCAYFECAEKAGLLTVMMNSSLTLISKPPKFVKILIFKLFLSHSVKSEIFKENSVVKNLEYISHKSFILTG